jgi:hypothetical protein
MREFDEGLLNNLTTNRYFAEEREVDETQHVFTDNPISSLFFSTQNSEALHGGLRYKIFKRTGRVIGRQSDVELRVVMRSIYMQYAKHLPYRVADQVRELNGRVLDYVVPRIVTEMSHYSTYTKDASSLPVPLEHAQNMSSKGSRTLHTRQM